MQSNTTQITLTLDNELAWALAQFVKRAYPWDVERCATSEEEKYQMVRSFTQLRIALAEAGIAPR